ncbi:MAG: exodeoxyribonuclease III, partial [Betaproteobacteria bacterium]
AQLCEWLDRDRPDVVCLQELKAEPSQVPARCSHADYHVYWHGMRAYSGVSLHVSQALYPTPPAFTHPAFDMETRIVQVALGNLVIASAYVPNGGKDYPAKMDFLTHLADWAGALHAEGRDVILCGDLNVAHADIDVHPRERKPGVIGQRPEERVLFDRLLGDHFVDVGRAQHPDGDAMFTWWPPWRNMRQRNIGWRIDYILASGSIAQRVTDCVVLADVGTSDHAPVMMTIEP